VKDLLPVIQLSRQPVVLAVHPSLGVNSLGELIAKAKQQPGLNYALGGGAGGQQHIVVEWFAHIAGLGLPLSRIAGARRPSMISSRVM
jgi:tripartite-type tricarboxylate transporter receptor subunit TctC